ncbi:hypothetical protein OAR19_00575, partial [bacterium]|nr:hypothetical protein [bacterium]
YTSTDSGVSWTARDSSRNWQSITSSSDGAKLAAVAYNEQIYTSTDSGVSWTERDSSRNWYSITSSSDGTKLAAVDQNGQIYTSTDSGVVWNEQDSGDGGYGWKAIASSSDGIKLAAVVDNGQIYTSTDSGETWTARAITKFWQSIVSSLDGTKLAAAAYNGQIYTSTDSGVSWTARDSSRSWNSITSSSDGTKLAACVRGGQIYTSTDSGVSWTARDSSRNWYSITSSSDGTNLAAVAENGQIYTSTDSGVSWTARDSSRLWYSITSSSDGTKLAAVALYGQIYTSTDSGVNWTARASGRGWYSITSSSDGTKLAACVRYGQIYTSTDSGVNWIEQAGAENKPWSSIASSSDGTKLAAVAEDDYIYTSTGEFPLIDPPSALIYNVQGNALNSGAGTVTLNWTDNSDNEEEFRIYVDDVLYITVNANQNNDVVLILSDNDNYQIYVTAYLTGAESVSSNIINPSLPDRTAPSGPNFYGTHWSTAVDPEAMTFIGANDSHSGVNTSGYKIYWGTDSNGTSDNTGTSTFDPPIISGGADTYYLNVQTFDFEGNYNNWSTVYIYNYQTESSTLNVNYVRESDGATSNFSDTDVIRIVGGVGNTENGSILIDPIDLETTLTDLDLSDIVIGENSFGNPYISVPSGGDLATAVNGNNKWVQIRLGPFMVTPMIKYSPDGGSYTAITDYDGDTTSTNIQNYNFDGTYVTFEVNHFSYYGSATLKSVDFADATIITDNFYADQIITVNVIDTMDDNIENAPVTFSIQSGIGEFRTGDFLENSVTTPIMILTNANGIATINYRFPNQKGSNVVKAIVDTVQDTIIMKIPGGLTASELALYNAWRDGYGGAGTIGGQQDDYDGDGVVNLLEWNWGIDATDPTDWDSDNDLINDKWDAYPNAVGTQVFDSSYNAVTTNGETFVGTAKDVNVVASSSNLTLTTLVDPVYIRYSTTDGIGNDSKTVIEINGLAKESVRDGNLAFASTTYSNPIYKGLKPGESYSVLFSYINRGNDTDSYTESVSLNQVASRWSTSYSNSGLMSVAPWQIADLEVTVLPNDANAFERVTLDVGISLSGGNTYSYSSHTNAYPGGTFNGEGDYGGTDNVSYEFVLEAEGFDLKVQNRIVNVSAPDDYTGVSVSSSSLVPGAKMTYSVVLYNNSYSVATSINLKDQIPNNCHFYYVAPSTPNVEGALAWEWQGVTDNNATSTSTNAINFEITLPSRGIVTASYTVTLD